MKGGVDRAAIIQYVSPELDSGLRRSDECLMIFIFFLCGLQDTCLGGGLVRI